MMNNVLFVNKPKGISSFDVCFKLRKVLNTKKIGHTGTLDPNATGVMIILFDNATKANQFLVTDKKTYKTQVLFGIETDTLDMDGNIINKKEYELPDKEQLIEVLNSFKGKSIQTVPLTSAVKINGKKLYQYQLEGKEVELPKREIEVYSIELNEILKDGFIFTANVSSGTYIRSLAQDILKKLDLIGTVKELERTMVDDITLEDCDSLDNILNNNYKKHNLLELLEKRYKVINIDNDFDVKNGKRIKLDCDNDRVVLKHDDELLAIYEKDNSEYRCVRGLW